MADNRIPLGVLQQSSATPADDSSSLNLLDLIRQHIEEALSTNKMHIFEYQLRSPEGPQDFEVRLVTSGPNEVLAMVRNLTKS